MTTNCYFKRGTSFIPSNEDQFDLHYTLPAEKFVIAEDPQTEALFLEQVTAEYSSPVKLYGKTKQHASRIMQTFTDRPFSTGVALTGEKGSGKTMLARELSILCAAQNMPTIVINQPWVGEKFNKLLQDIKQPCMVLFDEFEKTYDKEKQEQVLTLLDGVFPTKKLWVITSNDKNRIDAHMRNRPGRIYYMIEHGGVGEAEIRGYCNDNLKNTSHINEVVKVSQLFAKFNFDMMKAMVEEMNRFNEDPHQVMELLNARPQGDTDSKYNISLRIAGKLVDSLYPGTTSANPLGVAVHTVSYSLDDDKFDSSVCDNDEGEQKFRQADLVDVDLKNGVFKYKHASGAEAIYARENGTVGDFSALIRSLPYVQ
jgi:hypothetical protein